MFTSTFKKIGDVVLPPYTETRVMMLPFIIGDQDSLPSFVAQYRDPMLHMTADSEHVGRVGYLTVDEKMVEAGKSHRRSGLHVDGGPLRGWGGGGGWSSKATGAITVSSHIGCRAWEQEFDGQPQDEGDCEHLRPQLQSVGTIFEPNGVYWFDGMCVHESIIQTIPVCRQFVRISLPSTCPWYEGYTDNPLGIKPTGPILPRRKYMEVA